MLTTCFAIPLLFGACDDDPEPRRAITASGSVVNRTAAPLPTGARVLVAWVVTAGTPDYTYVFGQGSISSNGQRFTLRLDEPPPDSALNAGMLGVGLIVAVNEPVGTVGFGDGDLIPVTGAGIIGLAGQYAIIYIAEPGDDIGPEWMDDFPEGYSVGVGVDVEGGFDAFRPVSANEIELIIDDLGNIDVVNWT